MSFYRKLTIGEQVYHYHIGRSGVHIRGLPFVPMTVLTGMDWHTLEKGARKKWFGLTPGNVRDYLEGKPYQHKYLDQPNMPV